MRSRLQHLIVAGLIAAGVTWAVASASLGTLEGFLIDGLSWLREQVRGTAQAPTLESIAGALALSLLIAMATVLVRSTVVAMGFTALIGIAGIGVAGLAAFVVPMIAVASVSAFLVLAAYRLVVVDHSRRQLRRSFGSSLSPASIDRLLASGEQPPLDGEVRAVSVLYAVVDGVAGSMTGQDPTARIAALNRHVAAVTEIVEAQGGFIDKIIGDALIAVFGAPRSDGRHAESAVRAAIEVRGLFSAGKGGDLRIGVDSGTALVGSVGPSGRMTYTIIGEVTHLAARLARASRRYGLQVLVSEEAAMAAVAGILFREVDAVHAAGRKKPMTLLEPLATQEDALDADREKASAYAAAFHYWRAGRFAEAEAAFRTLANDPIAVAFADTSARLAQEPPEIWDGISDLDADESRD